MDQITRNVLGDYYILPLGHEEDFQAGVMLLTQVALNCILRGPAFSGQSLVERASLENSPLVQEKVEAFIKSRAGAFGRICNEGFPFATLQAPGVEKALETVLKTQGSIVVAMMHTEEGVWLPEKELEERFGVMVRSMHVSGIGLACHELLSLYHDRDLRAGYHLLWLIKYVSGACLSLADQEQWNKETVVEALQAFFSSEPTDVQRPATLVQLMLVREWRTRPALYQRCFTLGRLGILRTVDSTSVHRWMLRQFGSIPIEKWSDKGRWVMQWFKLVSDKAREVLFEVLINNRDDATAELGKSILYAHRASSLREAVPYLNKLFEQVPDFSETDVEMIFRWPMVSFLRKCSSQDTSKKRLCFNRPGPVFVHENLMMGVYESPLIVGGKMSPPYLLAYDMQTEKMVWGVALVAGLVTDRGRVDNIQECEMAYGRFAINRGDGYKITHVGHQIAIHFPSQHLLYLIDARSGEVKFSSELPDRGGRFFHVTAGGTLYQEIQDRKVRIGTIGDRVIHWAEESLGPCGQWLALSTHVGLQRESDLSVVGPKGKPVTIEGSSAAAFGEKLYVIRRDPDEDSRCFLESYTLLDDDSVISGVERRLSIQVEDSTLSIEALLQENILLLCSRGILEQPPIFIDDEHRFVQRATDEIWFWDPSCRKIWEQRPIFVDLSTGATVFGAVRSGDEHKLVQTATGEIWYWNPRNDEVEKVSLKGTSKEGTLPSSRGTTLVHVDANHRLYYTEISQ